jgi:hypothetical protein
MIGKARCVKKSGERPWVFIEPGFVDEHLNEIPGQLMEITESSDHSPALEIL